MFHVKQLFHQIHIILFFKSMIKSIRKNQKNTFFIIKTQASSLNSSNNKRATFELRKLINWSYKRYVSDLFLKMISEKRIENTLHIVSFILKTSAFIRLNQYNKHIKIWTSYLRHFKELWRWFSIFFDCCFFKKDDIQLSFIACITIRRF